ncbi:MAG: C25 family cysteine peptidase [Alphaproteobacteria bacterium]|nr:C25 family cysteine peptidase [Alphaproteobacteria bacterium]
MKHFRIFKALIFTGIITFSYQVKAEEHHNIILHTDKFKDVAQKFVNFHKEAEGVNSILVSVDELDKKPRTSKLRPPHDGFEKTKPTGFEIKNYNYELALKIADYLREYGNKNKLHSVMVLGNSSLIPPSYFFHNDYEKDLPAPSNVVEYTSWIGSDHYYGAPDFTIKYRWPVGRVAIETIEQAEHYLNKLKKFKEQIKEKPNTDFAFAGANVVHDYRVMGEMYRLALQKNGILTGNVSDYNETDGNLTKEKFLEALVKDPAEFMMFFTHGMGEGIVMSDEGMVTVKDILDLPEADRLKVVFSPSCLNAGFDYANIVLPFDPANKNSVAEAFVMSNVAIAYVGSTRLALANVKFETEKKHGRVMIKDALYMPGLLLELLTAYKEGKTRLGDAFKAAHDSYSKKTYGIDGVDVDKDFAALMKVETGARAMYAAYALIGDPVISLSPLKTAEESKHTGLEILNTHFTEEMRSYMSIPGFTPSKNVLSTNLIVKIGHGNKDITSPINYKIIDAKNSKIVKAGELKPGHVLDFKPVADKLTFLLQSWTTPSDMTWQYFFVEKADNADPEIVAQRAKAEEKPHRPLSAGAAVLPH